MSFRNYAQFGPVSRKPAQAQQPASSYGAFMMQMLPLMMQQARIQQQPIQPTPEQLAGVGQSPLGVNPNLPQSSWDMEGQPELPPDYAGPEPLLPNHLQQGPPVYDPRTMPPLFNPNLPPSSNPQGPLTKPPLPQAPPMSADPNYRRGAYLAMMRQGLKR